jgi:NAD(P)-dependent dehydrogenase (short-subunit alcohol dehydrogenase family)
MKVFITGVSSGIGLSLAEVLLERGDRVYGVSRREPKLKDHANFRFRSVDLSTFTMVPGTLNELLAGVGKLDLAILNAGVLGKIGDLRDTSLDDMRHVFDVNVWANKLVIDTLLSSASKVAQIVAISSGVAGHSGRGWNAYAISKTALNSLIGLYAAEEPETHFSALAPGIVDTAMQDQISGLPEDPRYGDFEYLREAKGTPLMPKPEEAAERLLKGMNEALKEPSGSFLDIHSLLKASG